VASGGNSWSFFGRGSYAGIDLAVFYRVAGASEATTVTFTSSSSTRFSGIIFELSGVATSAPGTSSGIINSTGTNNANDFYHAAAATSAIYGAPLATTYGYSDALVMYVGAWAASPGTINGIGTVVQPSQGTSNTAYVAATYVGSTYTLYNLVGLGMAWSWATARSTVAAPLYFVSQTQSDQATNAATGDASGIVKGAGLPTGVTVSTAANVTNAAETETETDTAGIAATLADINTATSASDSVSGASTTIIAANTNSTTSTTDTQSGMTITVIAANANSTTSTTDTQSGMTITAMAANANNLLTGAENTLGNTLQLAAAQSSSGVTAKVQAAAVPLALALALGGYGRSAAKGVPGKVAGDWQAATVRGATTTATVSSAWSTPTVHSAWEVVA
jgi:hypothetical protein